MSEYNAVNIRLENRESIDGLTDEDAGALFKALMCHGDGGDVDRAALPYGARTLYPIIAGQIDRAIDNYYAALERRKAAGSNAVNERWRRYREAQEAEKDSNVSANYTEANERNTNVYERMQTQEDVIRPIHNPNPNPNPNPNSNSITEKEKLKQKEKADDLRQGVLADGPVWDAFNEWVKMRARLKKPLTDRAARMAASKINRMTTEPAEALAIIEQSIFKNWLDFYDLKNDAPQPQGRRAINWEDV